MNKQQCGMKQIIRGECESRADLANHASNRHYNQYDRPHAKSRDHSEEKKLAASLRMASAPKKKADHSVETEMLVILSALVQANSLPCSFVEKGDQL
jgi:hypothetical protein